MWTSIRYMYTIERYMKILKGYVNNRSHPEGCIVERALIEESMEYCIKYLANVDAIGIPKPRHSGGLEGKGISACKVLSMPRAIVNQVHLCVLHNSSKVRPYENLHLDYLKKPYPHKSEKWRIEEHNRTFIDRFQTQISKELGYSPSKISDRLNGYLECCLLILRKWLFYFFLMSFIF